jgi:hypothetical protein
MVHVTTPKPNLGAAIGEGLGRGLEKSFDRNISNNALNRLQEESNKPNQTNADLLFNVVKAGLYTDLSRTAGPLYQTLLEQNNMQRGARDANLSFGGSAQGSGNSLGGGPANRNMQNSQGKEFQSMNNENPQAIPKTDERDFLDTVFPEKKITEGKGYIQDPTALQNFSLPYNENDFAKMFDYASRNGYSQAFIDKQQQRMKDLNEVAQTRRSVEISNYDQAAKLREDTLKNQDAFEQYLDKNSPEFTENPDERIIALNKAKNHQSLDSFSERKAAINKEMRPYQQAKKSLSKALERPLFGYPKDQLDLIRANAQEMINEGQKDQLRLLIAKGGQGANEEAYLLNPLPKHFETEMKNELPKFSSPLEFVRSVDPDSKEYNQQFEKGREVREKQENKMTDFLSNNIVPGTWEKPGTNLLLIRKDLMDKKLNWLEAGKMIGDAVRTGNIKLDDHQKVDIQKLAFPPLTGQTYMDTVLNNLFFSITGKE